MDEQTSDALDAIAKEPEDLDGHTIAQLADYLDSDRTPLDPAIEASPACQHALAALDRLRRLAPDLLVDDDRQQDDDWVSKVMGGIALDAHAGADFVLADGGSDARLVMTEGALRGLIRAAGDDEPGFLMGRVRFDGDLAPDARITIRTGVTVAHGVRIPAAVERLRSHIAAAVERHTLLVAARIDVDVDDLEQPATGGAA